MAEERGPSWYDLSDLAERLRAEYGCAIEFRLVPPVQRLDGRGYTAWTSCVHVTTLGAHKRTEHGFIHTWGARGTCRTSTAALYLGLLDAGEWLEGRQLQAAQQAAF